MRITEIITPMLHAPVAKESASAGATAAGSMATVPATGGGTLFGGSYEQPNNPFRKKGKKKK